MNGIHKDSEPDREILRKLFQGEASKEEEDLVIHWFSGLRHEARLNVFFKEHWDELNLGLPDLETSPLLDKIHHRIHVGENIESRRITIFSKLYRNFSKIAAILLIPLLLAGILIGRMQKHPYQPAPVDKAYTYTVYEKESWAEINVPVGTRARFELPDGSVGWLNSGSNLKYPVKFDGPSRRVELCGEAFFNVRKDPEQPFIVKVGEMEIIALGTTFNVSWFLDDESCKVTLETGKVIVNKNFVNQAPRKLAELKPGQHIIVPLKSNNVKISKEETDVYTSWKEGKLIFRNDPMTEVIKKLGRLYNAEFVLQDSRLLDYSYRATFIDESLDEVLKLLALSSPIGYKEKGRKVNPDGSFEKREIVLYITNN